MICKNCGTVNAEDATVCKNCGAALESLSEGESKEEKEIIQEDESKQQEQTAQSEISSEQEQAKQQEQNTGGQTEAGNGNSKGNDKVKSHSKKTLIACVGGGIVLIILVCLFLNRKPTIDLNKYLLIEATGYDGYGQIDVNIDWDAIEKEYGKDISLTSKAKKELGVFMDLATPMETLSDFVYVYTDKYDGLSNGDEVTYMWTIEEKLTEYIDCKIKYKDSTYKVSGLDKVEKFDPFSDLMVSFDGLSPNGSVKYEYTGTDFETYEFVCDKTNGLRNGDTIKIALYENNAEYYIDDLGKVPSKFEMEYTVEGLGEYVEAFSDLSEDFLNELKGEAEDAIYAYTANEYGSDTSLTALSYAGYILNKISDTTEYYDNYNALYLIYKGTVTNSENEFPSTTVYYPVRYMDIIKENGTFTYSEMDGVVGRSGIRISWSKTDGYTSPFDCYMEHVESKKETCISEQGDGFEIYSQYQLVSTLADITDSNKMLIQDEAKSVIEKYVQDSYGSNSKAENLKYEGDYLLISKREDVDIDERNIYVVVFSAKVSHEEEDFETTTVYFPVEFKGLVKLPNDEFVTSSCEGVQGSSKLPGGYSYRTSGYIDGEEMYREIITSNRDDYRYEVSEELKQFGN